MKQSSNVMFFSAYRFPPQIVSKKFDRFKHEYGFTFDDNGVRCLKPKREIDIQAEIQAFEGDCNIYNIINRYLYGDTNALNQVQSSYSDMVSVPKNLHEALNLSLRFKNDFYNLKPEVRAEFNNDFNQYIASISNGSVFDIFKKFGVKNSSQESLDMLNSQLNEIKEANANE